MASPKGSLSLTPAAQYTFPQIFYKHRIRPNPKPAHLAQLSVSGRTAVVTGGNAGIGLGCSRILLSLGLSHLMLAVRTPQKGEDAAKPLRQRYPKAKIDV